MPSLRPPDRVITTPGPEGARRADYVRQLEAIQRIGARLTQLATVEQIGLALCTEAREVLDYDNCRVYVVEDGTELRPVAFRSQHPEYDQETIEGLRARVGTEGEGLTGWVAATGEPLLVDDAAADPRALEIPGTTPAVESMLLVPVRYEERTTGVIVLSKLGAGRFRLSDQRLLQILADQAAVGFENARLLAGYSTLVAELQALVDLGRATSEAVEEGELARILVERIRAVSGADSAILSRWEEASTVLRTLAQDGARGEVSAAYDVIDYPLTREVLHTGEPAVVQEADDGADQAERRLMRGLDERTLVMLPLRAGGRTVGLLELGWRDEPHDPTADELRFFDALATQAGAALENTRLLESLRRVADVDQLTEVANHRHLQERLAQEIARAARTRRPLSVLMLDLDGFKAVNDSHGHAEGDRVLREVASQLKLAVRANDVVARYGGDEFVILMPDTAEGPAKVVAGRVLEGIRERRYTLRDGSSVVVGASAGLAIYPPDGRTPAELLAAADSAMYAVKRTGGGTVRRARRRTVQPLGA